MSPFEVVAGLIVVVAMFAYINHRWLRVAPMIGVTALSLVLAIVLLGADAAGLVPVRPLAIELLEAISLDDTLLRGMLGLLLFAGALHVDLAELRGHVVAVSALAFASTVLSTFAVAGLLFALGSTVALPLSFTHCLLFGALISPTDPIAVVGILARAGVPSSLRTQITGESLFNDGVGVVMFTTILVVANASDSAGAQQVIITFARETVGGATFGLLTGYLVYRILRTIDHYPTEVMITLALVLGGYAAAVRLHLSAPIAAVCSGLLIGNQGRFLAMSDVTRDRLDTFWTLIEEILNGVLFLLVGLELLRLTVTSQIVFAAVLAVPIALAARFASVLAVLLPLSRRIRFARGSAALLTWGGMRGAISFALALSLPAGPVHDVLVPITYGVVVFSILVQGLTLDRLARHYAS